MPQLVPKNSEKNVMDAIIAILIELPNIKLGFLFLIALNQFV